MHKNNLHIPVDLLRRISINRVGLVALLLLAACDGGNSVPDMQPQMWEGAEVRVESRPSPPRAGINEFLVIVTGERGPVHDIMVSVRTDDHDQWVQAIQDGEVGVYRRAATVGSGTRSVLQVQLKRHGTEEVLLFPLKIEP